MDNNQNYNPNYNQNPNQNYNPNYNQNPNPDYNQNYNQGYNPNYNQNYNQGYNPNYNQNYNQGYNPNYNQGYNPGYNPDYGTRGPVGQAPSMQLRTNRGLAKMILLSIITFGIYGLVVWCHLSEEINTVASRYDGKKTMHFLIAFLLLGGITLGIVPLVWISKYCNRLGAEVARRGIAYPFGAGTFWGWGVLGSLIIVGPFIFTHKLLKAANMMNTNYNMYG